MKAYQIQTAAGIDGLKLVDLLEPEPFPTGRKKMSIESVLSRFKVILSNSAKRVVETEVKISQK